MEFDKSAASPRPAYFGSTLEISRRRDTTSRVTCLTNLQTIGFGPFEAFRAGTRWALSISLMKMLKPMASNMRTQSFVVSIAGSLDAA